MIVRVACLDCISVSVTATGSIYITDVNSTILPLDLLSDCIHCAGDIYGNIQTLFFFYSYYKTTCWENCANFNNLIIPLFLEKLDKLGI